MLSHRRFSYRFRGHELLIKEQLFNLAAAQFLAKERRLDEGESTENVDVQMTRHRVLRAPTREIPGLN
jgi:hypothetical protein